MCAAPELLRSEVGPALRARGPAHADEAQPARRHRWQVPEFTKVESAFVERATDPLAPAPIEHIAPTVQAHPWPRRARWASRAPPRRSRPQLGVRRLGAADALAQAADPLAPLPMEHALSSVPALSRPRRALIQRGLRAGAEGPMAFAARVADPPAH